LVPMLVSVVGILWRNNNRSRRREKMNTGEVCE